MRKLIATITIVCFAVIAAPVAVGGAASAKCSAAAEGTWIEDLLGLSTSTTNAGAELTSSTTTAGKKKKKKVDEVLNEAIGSQGERPNLELLARLYEMPVDEIIAAISEMVAAGDIDIEKALIDPETSDMVLTSLGRKLENLARNQEGASLTLLQKFREKAGCRYDSIIETVVPSLETANLFRSLVKCTEDMVK